MSKTSLSIQRPTSSPRLILLALAVSFLASGIRAEVVLNEIMANNRSAVANGSGFPDYVELLNPSDQPVVLTGWSLTDDPGLPRRFVFPETTLPAGERLLVWCSTTPSGPGLYAPFGLGASGDRVLLFDQNQTPVDTVAFGLQAEDFTLGRIPDGTGVWTLNRPTPLAGNEAQAPAEAPALRINEWMARPAAGEDWLELYNPDDLPAVLSGLVLTDGNSVPPGNRAIPELSFLAPRGFIQMFASDLKDPDADHLDFKLSADGETLSLFGPDRQTLIDRITFGSQLAQTSQGRVPDGGDSLAFFAGTTATPGQPNVATEVPIVIHEVLSHTDPPLEDAVELHNPTTEPADLSHWWLSDSLTTPRKYRIPAGTVVPPGGFIVFYDYQFGRGANGFSLNSYEGDRVVLSSGGSDGELTGSQVMVRFGALRNGVSIGRVPTSVGVDFVPLAARTFGEDQPASLPQFRLGTGRSNAPARISPVVVNEIHFQPASDRPEDEFVELHNPTSAAVPLFDPAFPTNTWRIRDGITFDFPQEVTVPPGAYLLIVGFDPQQETPLAAFRSRFGVPDNVPVFGPFTGRLSDSGEAVESQHPDKPEGPDAANPGFVPYELLERIHYLPGPPWPAGLAGSSLQRRDATAYGNEPLNWFTGSPTAGRANQSGPTDADQDGLPDDWEQTHGLNPNDPTDALADADGDTATNQDEFLAGTDPEDPQSRFYVQASLASGLGWELTFHSVAGRTYSVEAGTLAHPGGWQSITNLAARDATGSRTILLPVSPDGNDFLRLRTPALP